MRVFSQTACFGKNALRAALSIGYQTKTSTLGVRIAATLRASVWNVNGGDAKFGRVTTGRWHWRRGDPGPDQTQWTHQDLWGVGAPSAASRSPRGARAPATAEGGQVSRCPWTATTVTPTAPATPPCAARAPTAGSCGSGFGRPAVGWASPWARGPWGTTRVRRAESAQGRGFESTACRCHSEQRSYRQSIRCTRRPPLPAASFADAASPSCTLHSEERKKS